MLKCLKFIKLSCLLVGLAEVSAVDTYDADQQRPIEYSYSLCTASTVPHSIIHNLEEYTDFCFRVFWGNQKNVGTSYISLEELKKVKALSSIKMTPGKLSMEYSRAAAAPIKMHGDPATYFRVDRINNGNPTTYILSLIVSFATKRKNNTTGAYELVDRAIANYCYNIEINVENLKDTNMHIHMDGLSMAPPQEGMNQRNHLPTPIFSVVKKYKGNSLDCYESSDYIHIDHLANSNYIM